jgi:hypothetical protein
MDVHNDEVKEFQLKLEGILKEFLEQGSIEVYGNLRIVVTSFNKPSRIAFQKREHNLRQHQGKRVSGFGLKIYNCS